MDQAAVLPDPLDEPASSLASPDDLLAQLAGEEIDRLLAENESGSAAEAAGDAAHAPPPPPVAEGEADVNLAALAQEVEDSEELRLSAEASQAAAASVEAPASAEAVTAAQVEPLAAERAEPAAPATAPLAGVVLEPPPAAPANQATPPVVAAPDVPAAAAVSPPVASPTPTPTQAIGLSESAPAAKPLDPADVAAQRAALNAVLSPAAERTGDGDSLPFYLKPLEWLNAPLQSCSEGVRDALGKAAIVTLVNSVGVLLYVVLFRRG